MSDKNGVVDRPPKMYTCSSVLSPPFPLRGRLKRSARAVQLFGRLAVLETHTLRY